MNTLRKKTMRSLRGGLQRKTLTEDSYFDLPSEGSFTFSNDSLCNPKELSKSSSSTSSSEATHTTFCSLAESNGELNVVNGDDQGEKQLRSSTTATAIHSPAKQRPNGGAMHSPSLRRPSGVTDLDRKAIRRMSSHACFSSSEGQLTSKDSSETGKVTPRTRKASNTASPAGAMRKTNHTGDTAPGDSPSGPQSPRRRRRNSLSSGLPGSPRKTPGRHSSMVDLKGMYQIGRAHV